MREFDAEVEWAIVSPVNACFGRRRPVRRFYTSRKARGKVKWQDCTQMRFAGVNARLIAARHSAGMSDWFVLQRQQFAKTRDPQTH
ncbi:hypothetical protein AAV99_03615 [Aurantiacibacter marinus]|uniref:Uncharacterized protein n=1 Tax=Aurantiacibacter marinus TaxID=874156 RepID=A0A0H0XRM3_9SPHN|nr:hypothetical protein AAV99_03615 [Aurantiacibacter marinus]